MKNEKCKTKNVARRERQPQRSSDGGWLRLGLSDVQPVLKGHIIKYIITPFWFQTKLKLF
jgi:hypothetical protein